MWIVFAFVSAAFAGLTSIFAKCGIKSTDSDVVTALRTSVILIFAWIMVFISGSYIRLSQADFKSLIFLLLSGLSTGVSWLCYFRALQLGDVSKVTPVDKSSTILTMMFAFIFIGEKLTFLSVLSIIIIAFGTYLMIGKKNQTLPQPKSENPGKIKLTWLFYAVMSAVFAALTSILAKAGLSSINSTFATAVRTIVVLIMAWIIVFAKNKQRQIKFIDKKSLLFIALSGISGGCSWLCYYYALQKGLVSVVAPIDKLSILITVAFSYFILKEKISRKALFGLILIVCGTLMLLI